jgi:hypothetical protein
VSPDTRDRDENTNPNVSVIVPQKANEKKPVMESVNVLPIVKPKRRSVLRSLCDRKPLQELSQNIPEQHSMMIPPAAKLVKAPIIHMSRERIKASCLRMRHESDDREFGIIRPRRSSMASINARNRIMRIGRSREASLETAADQTVSQVNDTSTVNTEVYCGTAHAQMLFMMNPTDLLEKIMQRGKELTFSVQCVATTSLTAS